MRTIEDRLWPRIVPDGDCWVWTGARSAEGYGQVGHLGKVVYTHRLSYELMVAEIPEGLFIDHLCRNRACMNPYHLEPVTHTVNVRRGIVSEVNKRRYAELTHCRRGHPLSSDNVYVTKVGWRQCRACRRLRSAAAKKTHEDGESA